MRSRILRVTISVPGGDVVLTESLSMHVRVAKAALAMQSRASIEVVGLTTTLRERLLSQFTAFNNNRVQQGTSKQYQWIGIKIEAGYLDGTNLQKSLIFVGEIVTVEPVSSAPDIGVRITAYTRQIDKSGFFSEQQPTPTTYKGYVIWAAGQMGIIADCQTSYDDFVIENPARSLINLGQLVIDIQNMYRTDVAAFIDNDILIVRDRNNIINKGSIANVTEFVGIPTWTEWGVEFTCLFDQNVKLAQAATLKSKMNPTLNDCTYVITSLEYDLSSRSRAFYVRANGMPPG